MSSRHLIKRVGVGLMVLVFAPLAYIFFEYQINNWYSFWNNQALKISQTRSNEIVDALNLYKSKNGKFPNALNELVPTYLPRILPPEIAKVKKWKYVTTKTGFYLEYGNSTDREPVAYRTESEGWAVDTK